MINLSPILGGGEMEVFSSGDEFYIIVVNIISEYDWGGATASILYTIKNNHEKL